MLCVLFASLLLFCGCGAREGAYFAPLEGEFEAELDGTLHGMDFAANLAVTWDGENARRATLTFYAPATLADTVLVREADGELLMSAGGVTLAAPCGYGQLFSLFLEIGDVTEVALEGDVTRVSGEAFSFCFAADGTPVSAKGAGLDARILSFSAN